MYSDQQKVINKQFKKQYNMPVLLYPQLLGMALGGDPKNDLGLDLNAISLDDLLAKAGINRKF
jgi:heterodisulfide reductase subunit B